MDPYFIPILFACLCGGVSLGLIGVYIVGMRIPFISICISHAAMVGAIIAQLCGLPQLPVILAAAIVASTALGFINPRKLHLDRNVTLGVLFSLMMGLVFLGMGLSKGPKTPMLGLLWGSLLFVGHRDAVLIFATSLGLWVFAFLFAKEMKAILFSRLLALASGMHEGFVWGLFLLLCGVTLSVNLNTVGGLMIYSLITNPAAAAFQLATGYRESVILALIFGGISAVGGFFIAYFYDLPVGACIALFSVVLFVVALICRTCNNKHS